MIADLTIVERIATQTQQWAARYAEKNNWPADLCGLCAIASAQLFKRLKAAGVADVVICANDYHCFLMLGEMIIDITAGQFGVAKDNNGIVIDHKPQWPPRYWEPVATFTSVPALIKHQRKEGWRESQIARR